MQDFDRVALNLGSGKSDEAAALSEDEDNSKKEEGQQDYSSQRRYLNVRVAVGRREIVLCL